MPSSQGNNDQLAGRLAVLFRGLERAHGEYRPPPELKAGEKRETAEKIEGKHYFPSTPLTKALWLKHLRGELRVGVVPITDEGVCYFAAIDVDRYAVDDAVVIEMWEKVKQNRLPLIPVRSKSGGAQLYTFFKDGAPAPFVRKKLKEWLGRLGLPESTEVFPKQDTLEKDDKGSWINMPYFGVSGATGTERYAIYEREPLTADEFCDLAERVAAAALKEMEDDDADVGFKQGPPCLETLLGTGKTGDFRNNLLFNIGVYYRFKRKEERWEEWVKKWNEQHVEPPLDPKELNKILKSLARKADYNYRCKDQPICTACNRELCVTRKFGVGQDTAPWPVFEARRILGDQPHYELKMNGGWVAITAVDICSQHRFRAIVYQHLKICPTPMSSDDFLSYINALGQNSVDEEKPVDADPSGEVAYYLRKYLSGHRAETWEELSERDLPYSEGELVYFKGPAFKRFLSQQRAGLNLKEVWGHIRRLGGETRQVRALGEVITTWVIKFERAKVSIPTKRIKDDAAM